MNAHKFFAILIFVVSCTAHQEPVRKPINLSSEVDLFLSTTDAKTESQVLERLKSAQVSNATVKALLRERIKTHTGPVGLQ
ncbi:MAG: hypothetical protein HOJ49_10855, partial [Nitrospina sp.]|nr:hypothetical protein [Nitrospina sp.]